MTKNPKSSARGAGVVTQIQADLNDVLKQVLADGAGENLAELICGNVESYVSTNRDDIIEREKQLFDLAVWCLNYFVQNNWTGPPGTVDLASYVPARFQASLAKMVNGSLEVDGENIYELSAYPICLLLANSILHCLSSNSDCWEYAIWCLRCCKIHQDLLRERAPMLKAVTMDLIERLLASDKVTKDCERYMEFLLEASHLLLYYYEYKKGAALLEKATNLVQITTELAGVLGKRTKYQQEKKAQLICRIRRKNTDEKVDCDKSESKYALPKDLPLNSEVLLERPQCDGDADLPDADVITPLESAFVMTTCLHNRRLQASSALEEEETVAFIEAILAYRCNWAVASRALFMRSLIEKKKSKRFERSLLQLEELVNQFRYEDPPVECRLPTLYASQMLPIWLTEKELAHLYISYGSTNTALEIFLKLRLWPEAIECYTHLGRLEKAESVIRERLAENETPDLYCYLGDVTNDLSCYEKAWQLSKCKSSRAQRSWAFQLFSKTKFEEAITHFEKSLEINQLQAGVWFTYGCACMAVNELTKAITAFKRCVQLEYDNFQAWTNLSACMAKNNDRELAFRVLDDALKCNYENFRIWENYVVIGLDCGEFEHVVRGYHRLLDLKNKHVDIEILSILVRVVNEEQDDCHGVSAARLRPKLQELLGRQTSMVTTDSKVWKLYGQLIGHPNSTVENKAEKAIQHYQKSQRCLTQRDDYLTDVKLAEDVVSETDQLLKVYLDSIDAVTNTSQAVQMLASIKLTTTNVLTKIKNKHRDLMNQLVADLVEPCGRLEASLKLIVDKMTTLKDTE